MNDENKDEGKMLALTPSAQREQMLQSAEQDAIKFMNPKTWDMMKAIATEFIKSGALPKGIDSFPKLMMVLQAGVEAGMRPLQAINSFYIVNGKVSMYGEQCIAQVLKAGHTVEFKNCDANGATCKITRKDTGTSLESTFTMEMARSRGLAKNPPYQTAPENMMKFKAFHMTAKFIVPEALHGIDLGEIIEAETVHREATVTVMPKNESLADTQRKTVKPAKSLEEALVEPEPEIEIMPENPKSTRKRATAKKVEPEVMPTTTVEGESNASKLMKQGMAKAKAPKEQTTDDMGDPSKETDDEKFERITTESADRRLTEEEAKFLVEYPAIKEKRNKLV